MHNDKELVEKSVYIVSNSKLPASLTLSWYREYVHPLASSRKDRELVDYAKMRKKYFDNLRNIEYFSICKKPKNMKYGQKLHFASFTNSL